MASYRYYLIPDVMTLAFPERFETQTPREFFDSAADLKRRYVQLREQPYNNEPTYNERTKLPYVRLEVGIERKDPGGALAVMQVRGGIKLLNQAPDDANDIARLLHISDEEKRYIENAEVGSGLLIADKVVVPFNNTFPQDTELFRLMDTNPNRKK